MKRSSFNLALAASVFMLAAPPIPAADEAPPFTRENSFLVGHPDLDWRQRGIKAYEQDRYDEAMNAFRRAARYADKPSQAMIAQMLWNGDGVPADRVMAYVWADLAAERGYPAFIATRERFWSELDADEQRKAIDAGQAIFEEYGDGAAGRREKQALLRARSNMTGSRTGRPGTVVVQQYDQETGRFSHFDGALFYAGKYWQPEPYWKWQGSIFEELPEGEVQIGPLQVPSQR